MTISLLSKAYKFLERLRHNPTQMRELNLIWVPGELRANLTPSEDENDGIDDLVLNIALERAVR